MVMLACDGEDRLEASDLEAGTIRSYTIDTLARVRSLLGGSARLWFIIGADAFAEIATWHRWTDVLQQTEFVVVTRPGHEYSIPAGARVHALASVQLPISSSEVRAKLARGEQPHELPDAVFTYIRDHRLYGFGTLSATPGPQSA
jgi:nicotinate-nucleotide adenylyltransferase